MSTRKKKTTPIRSSLKKESPLLEKVCDGIQALEKTHRKMIAQAAQAEFADSLDLDKATLQGNEQDNRWDYLLGHTPSDAIVALEPHSASDGEVSTVIKKKQAAREQLRDHLEPGKGVDRWLWVASGKVGFTRTEKARLRLDQKGIQFVGKQVLPKHLI